MGDNLLKEKIETKFKSIDGFKSIFTGLFGGGKAKKSFEVYSTAATKGVIDNITLRSDSHDGTYYAIMAFRVGGAIDDEMLKELKNRTSGIPLGTIRYESLSYSRLELWRGGKESFARKNASICAIAPEWPDVFIYPVASSKIANLTCPFVIYAHKDGEDYIYPLMSSKLDKLR